MNAFIWMKLYKKNLYTFSEATNGQTIRINKPGENLLTYLKMEFDRVFLLRFHVLLDTDVPRYTSQDREFSVENRMTNSL